MRIQREKNLTRAHPKGHGCGFMGMALSMGSYKHDIVDAAHVIPLLQAGITDVSPMAY